MPRVTHVKKARKAIPQYNIEVGDSYYWWKFKNCAKQASKSPPKPWQLTRSEFLRGVYILQDRIADTTTDQLSEEWRDGLVEDIRNIGEQCQESLDNMPDSLQYSPTGEMLQERIDAMETWAEEVENVEIPDMGEVLGEIQEIEPEIC